ncbi:uncharacterized protein Z519_08772 [Cladophialophora bantiana CBS 173.52]|uniref:Uncharacterized protein n=1 Tax=Cladophialophora bantiana (strain ATCC 10958 / CBS 173.52 / CDC B-1940 / NIH 8579) TaxID=1442370 RepID=A0A0D2I2A6_CLAB1|nr:uncharacterized protein Z519_08772 [Cladophialophora bantiana CBS 173.52]KIW90989.1 hypothetical protein Z519_08772 [Cladophialophora bantiana CBS 173.52]
MLEKLLSLFKKKDSGGKSSHPTKPRRPSDPYSGLSEVAVPPPIQNRDESEVFLHHTLEESLRRISRGQENEAESGASGDVLIRHHTLEENIKLARELSQELRRQSDELRRRSSQNERNADGRSSSSP